MKKLGLFIIIALYNKASAQSVNWAEDIACVLYTHCTSCHNPNGTAPFSLIEYNQAFTFRNSIKFAVENGHMPPWPPNHEYQAYAHQRIMPQSDIDLITEWVNNGAPEGDPTLAPIAPIYSTQYEISSPDLVLKIPTYTVPNLTSSDLYRCFVIPTNLLVDKNITAMEVVPGNPNIVHHVLSYYDTANTTVNLDNLDPEPGYTSFGGIGSGTAMPLGGWVPGSRADFFPDGLGMALPKNSYIILQIHYPVGSTGQVDSTEIRFKFTDSFVRPLYSYALLEHSVTLTNGPLIIPPNTIQTFHSQFLVPPPLDASIIGIAPHAHLICESMKAFGVTPSGDTIPLVDIPNWDFHWQGVYYFQKPIKIPVGTTLHGYATYNNTLSNPHNPSNPPQWVFLGEDTKDEMMLFYFTFTYYLPGDENIIIDTNTYTPYYNNCKTTGLQESSAVENYLQVYPNPGHQEFFMLNVPENAREIDVSVYSQEGMLVYKNKQHANLPVNISFLSTGSYIVECKLSNNQILRQKFIKL